MNKTIIKSGENLRSKLSIIAVIGFSVFLITTFVLHFLQPDYDTSKKYVSEFILGQYGWLLNLAIIGNFVGCGAFTLAFYSFHKSNKSWICLGCLCVATLSVLSNFFPTDIHGKAVTISGYIHNIGIFAGTLAIFPVMVIFPYQLKRIGLLSGKFITLAILAPLAPVFFLVLLVMVSIAPNIVGIGQRVYALIIMLWLILAAFRLKTMKRENGQ
jgi:hypothetical protein